MGSKRVRVGVIGTGAAARAHIEALRLVEDADVVAVVGTSEANAKQVSTALGVGSYTLRPDDIFQSSQVDGVVLATPPAFIADLAVRAFANGKHVLCEKPLGIDSSQAQRVAAAWRASSRVGLINFCYRLLPEFQEFRRILDAGRCGQLNVVKASWTLPNRLNRSLTVHWKGEREQGGGVLQNYGVHLLDFLFADQRDVRVLAARQQTVVRQRLDATGTLRDTSGDEVTTALFLSQQVPVIVHLSLVARPGMGFSIVAEGTDGTLELLNPNISCAAGPFHLKFCGEPIAPRSYPSAPAAPSSLKDLFARPARAFIDAIQRRGPSEPCIERGLQAARLVDRVYQVSRADSNRFDALA